jgi:hypothetical protein
MTQPAQHAECQCEQMAALVAELVRRVNTQALILTRVYLAENKTPPAELGPVAIAAAGTAQGPLMPGRTPLIALPGGAA